jgi:tetraacyldisaccharide 4'-kinase
VAALLLTPLGLLLLLAGRLRRRLARPLDPGPPVICVGNLTVGGAGKTPIARALLVRLRAMGVEAHGLSRGHGGRERGPLRVDLDAHAASDVGDEPLLLARDGPMWIARRRPLGALAAAAAGAEALVLDDGHQNPLLLKRLSLVVVDGESRDGEWPFGDGRLFPAGPLREPLKEGLGRADAAVVLLPADLAAPAPELLELLAPLPVLIARLEAAAPPPTGPQMGFAGVAKPWKVERSLRAAGCDLADFAPFPDHHPFTAADLRFLKARAGALEAGLVTTEKDWVRLPPAARAEVAVFKVTARFEDPDALDALLASGLAPARDTGRR